MRKEEQGLQCPFAPYQAECMEEKCRLWMARRNKCAFECLALDARAVVRQGGDE